MGRLTYLVGAVLFACAMLPCGQAFAGTVNGSDVDMSLIIPDDVPESQQLINDIESWYSSASRYIHNATGQQLKFGKLVIFIPEKWKNIQNTVALGDLDPEEADIILQPGKTSASAHPGGFTNSSQHIFFGEGFLKQNSGPATLIHEFGHYGFNLGDEYCNYETRGGLFGIGATRWQVFKDKNGVWNRCTEKTDFETNVPEAKGGNYSVSKANSNGESASIMWYQHEASIVEWCTAANHFSTPNNNQNAMHNNKSCWDVITGNVKFGMKHLNDPGRTKIAYSAPTFELRRASGIAEIELVIDRSGSMDDENKMEQAKTAAQVFVNQLQVLDNSVPVEDRVDPDAVGVISFSSSANQDFPLTLISTPAVKQQAISAIGALSAGGSTSLSAGLGTALSDLQANTLDPGNIQAILMLTDGIASYPSSAVSTAQSRNIPIYTVGLGSDVEADDLRQIASSTGGRYFFAAGGRDLSLIYSEIKRRLGIVDRIILFFDDVLSASSVSTESIPVDSSLGRVSFTLFGNPQSVVFELISPTGQTITPQNAGNVPGVSYNESDGFAAYSVENPQNGAWNVRATNMSGVNQEISFNASGNSDLRVTANTTAQTVSYPEPIVIRASTARGGIPVVGLTLEARITDPDGDVYIVPMNDAGVEGDAIPGDGSYSGTFATYNQNGDYSVAVVASNESGTAMEGVEFPDLPIVNGKRMNYTRKQVPEDFQRIAIAPALTVRGYSTTDRVAPGKIDSLRISDGDTRGMTTLTWYSPGEDLYEGTAKTYLMRYASGVIASESDWNSASELAGLPTPKVAGTEQSFSFVNPPGNLVMIALRAVDDAGNVSPISNNVTIGSNDVALEISVLGSGTTSPPEGMNFFEVGTTVTVNATPASGWIFSNWDGDVTSTSPSIRITMDRDKHATAVFTQKGRFIVSCGADATGTHDFRGDLLLLVGLAAYLVFKSRWKPSKRD